MTLTAIHISCSTWCLRQRNNWYHTLVTIVALISWNWLLMKCCPSYVVRGSSWWASRPPNKKKPQYDDIQKWIVIAVKGIESTWIGSNQIYAFSFYEIKKNIKWYGGFQMLNAIKNYFIKITKMEKYKIYNIKRSNIGINHKFN